MATEPASSPNADRRIRRTAAARAHLFHGTETHMQESGCSRGRRFEFAAAEIARACNDAGLVAYSRARCSKATTDGRLRDVADQAKHRGAFVTICGQKPVAELTVLKETGHATNV